MLPNEEESYEPVSNDNLLVSKGIALVAMGMLIGTLVVTSIASVPPLAFVVAFCALNVGLLVTSATAYIVEEIRKK